MENSMNRNGQFFNYRRIKFAWSCWNEALLWTIHSKINGKKENTYSVKLLWICQANDPRSQRSKRSQIVIVIKLFRCKVNKFNLKFNLKTVNTAIHRHLFHKHHIAMTITISHKTVSVKTLDVSSFILILYKRKVLDLNSIFSTFQRIVFGCKCSI